LKLGASAIRLRLKTRQDERCDLYTVDKVSGEVCISATNGCNSSTVTGILVARLRQYGTMEEYQSIISERTACKENV
jgi:hypothetical protein